MRAYFWQLLEVRSSFFAFMTKHNHRSKLWIWCACCPTFLAMKVRRLAHKCASALYFLALKQHWVDCDGTVDDDLLTVVDSSSQNRLFISSQYWKRFPMSREQGFFNQRWMRCSNRRMSYFFAFVRLPRIRALLKHSSRLGTFVSNCQLSPVSCLRQIWSDTPPTDALL